MQVTSELGLYFVQSDGSNSSLSPVVYGDIALSIKKNNTIYPISLCNKCGIVRGQCQTRTEFPLSEIPLVKTLIEIPQMEMPIFLNPSF